MLWFLSTYLEQQQQDSSSSRRPLPWHQGGTNTVSATTQTFTRNLSRNATKMAEKALGPWSVNSSPGETWSDVEHVITYMAWAQPWVVLSTLLLKAGSLT
jgi:hypothetical protein